MSDIRKMSVGELARAWKTSTIGTELARRLEAAEADRDRWKAIAEKRHAILLDLEWCKESDESYCPCCMAIDGETHIAGCKMAEAIAESANVENTNG